MSEDGESIDIDLLPLFQNGGEEWVTFGTTTRDMAEGLCQGEAQEIRMPDDDNAIRRLRVGEADLFFLERPERFFAASIKFDGVQRRGASGAKPQSGRVTWRFGSIGWCELMGLSDALRTLDAYRADMDMSSPGPRMVSLRWAEGRRRLELDYAFESLQRGPGLFEYDYFLQSVRVIDRDIEAALRASLKEAPAQDTWGVEE